MTKELKVGDVIHYNDMANVNLTYIVIGLPDHTPRFTMSGYLIPGGNEYTLRGVEAPFRLAHTDPSGRRWEVLNEATERWESVED